MVDMRPYQKNVHKSLFQRDLLLGVPTMGLVLVFCLSAVFLYLFRWFFMAVPIALFYFFIRHLTSLDPYFIEMFLDYFQQKDVFLP